MPKVNPFSSVGWVSSLLFFVVQDVVCVVVLNFVCCLCCICSGSEVVEFVLGVGLRWVSLLKSFSLAWKFTLFKLNWCRRGRRCFFFFPRSGWRLKNENEQRKTKCIFASVFLQRRRRVYVKKKKTKRKAKKSVSFWLENNGDNWKAFFTQLICCCVRCCSLGGEWKEPLLLVKTPSEKPCDNLL